MLIQNSLNTYNASPLRITAGINYSGKNQVSFEAMKKSEFHGMDFAAVEKFKAPIEKFNTHQDLQNWAYLKTFALLNKNYIGRHKETTKLRNEILEDWNKFFTENYNEVPPVVQLLIVKSITKDLKENNDILPPDLNTSVAFKVLKQINIKLKEDPKYQFDFNKLYITELQSSFLDDEESQEPKTDWITIPSKIHDKYNFDSNIKKLKTLSAKRWCTKSSHSSIYLQDDDFHIYIENGKPKIAIRLWENKIEEIEGELNNGVIPQDYLQIVKDYIKEKNFPISEIVSDELLEAEERALVIKQAKLALNGAIKNNDIEKLFDYFKIQYETDDNGLITLTRSYMQPMRGITWKDIGVNENDILKRVKCICGYCDMSSSNATNFGEVREIKGYLKLAYSKLTDLGKLESVDNINFEKSNIRSLGNLRYINQDVTFSNSEVVDLGKLKFIGNNADFSNSKIKSLKNLEIIKGNAKFRDSEVTELGNLYKIGNNADFINSKIQELKNLRIIGGNALFAQSDIRTLNNLEHIGGYADFFNSKIENLGKLKTIRQDAIFTQTPLLSLGNLENIGGSINFNNTNIKDTGNLKSIGKNATFCNSQITSLNKIETIGKNADFSNSNVTDLGRLQYIGGNANFINSNIARYNNLHIDGNATFNKGKIPENININGNIIEISDASDTQNNSNHRYFDKLKHLLFH